MKTYALIIRKTDADAVTSGVRTAFEQGLKRVYPSYDYMLGFIEGYGFGKLLVRTLSELEHLHNDQDLSHHSYIYFVRVESPEYE